MTTKFSDTVSNDKWGSMSAALESGLCGSLAKRIRWKWCCDSFWDQILRNWQLPLPVFWDICFWNPATMLWGRQATTWRGHTLAIWPTVPAEVPTDSPHQPPDRWVSRTSGALTPTVSHSLPQATPHDPGRSRDNLSPLSTAQIADLWAK